jgi:hypothetical protein
MNTSISAIHSYAGDSLTLDGAHDATALEFHRISPASGPIGPIRGFLNVNDGLDKDHGDGLPVRPLPSQGDGHNNNPILIGIVLGWAICEVLDGVNDAVKDAMKPKAAPPPPAPAPTPPPPAPTNGSGPTTVFV